MKYSISNRSNLDLTEMKPFLSSFLPFARQKMGFDKPVSINFVSDPQNSSQVLGKTAFYDPNDFSVTIYTDQRHPKDIMRSLSHELVHHSQNCRGAFDHKPEYGEGYFHQDEYMREMEREAYEVGNMCFRSWEETYKKQLHESNYYRGETKMNLKEWKNQELFDRLTEGYGYKKPMEEVEIDEAHCNEGELGEAHCNEGELDEAHCNEAEMDEGMCGPCVRCGHSPCQCPPMEEGERRDKEKKFASNQPPYDKATAKDRAGPDGSKHNMKESQLRTMIREAISKALAKRQ